MNRPYGNHFNSRWTDEHHAELVKYLAAGFSSSRAADEVNKKFGTNYTRNAVIGRANRMNIPRGELQRTKPCPTSVKPWQREGISERTYRWRKQKQRERMEPKIKPAFKCDETKFRTADVVPLHLPLLDLGPNMCRWPFGEGPVSTVKYSFCGNPTLDECPYCFEHSRLSLRDAA